MSVSRHNGSFGSCPLYPQKRTFVSRVGCPLSAISRLLMINTGFNAGGGSAGCKSQLPYASRKRRISSRHPATKLSLSGSPPSSCTRRLRKASSCCAFTSAPKSADASGQRDVSARYGR